MDRRSILAYAVMLLIILVIVATIGWMIYNGAAGKGRRRARAENRERARDRAKASIGSAEDPSEPS
jgi:hypothetical protein